MKRNLIAGALCALLAGVSSVAYACQFDTDCGIGARCIKQGRLYGFCAAGLQPGNRWDQRPVRDLYGGSTGNTCTSSFQCGVGHKCVKSGLYGVCVRSW